MLSNKELTKRYNEITFHSYMYENEINNKIEEFKKSEMSSNFYDLFYKTRRFIYNIHKTDKINLYIISSYTNEEAIKEYEKNFITEDEYVYYRDYIDE